MAAPHVAGAATLLFGQNPARTTSGVKSLLMATVDIIPAAFGKVASNGRLNLASAVNCDASKMSLRVANPSEGFKYIDRTYVPIIATVSACGIPIADAKVMATFNNGEPDVTLFDDGMHKDGVANDGLFGGEWFPTVVGKVALTVIADSASYGTATQSVNGIVTEKIFYAYKEVPYSWIDTTNAYPLYPGDDSSYGIFLGFPFEFYGVKHDVVQVSSNGFFSFTNWEPQHQNETIPNAAIPNGLIAPFWDDLKPAYMYLQFNGAEPNRSVTITWEKASHYGSPVGNVTFQATLYEGTNEIVVNYNNVMFGDERIDAGASATVGVEDQKGEEGTLFSFEKASLRNEMALHFRPIFVNTPPTAFAGGPYAGTRLAPVVFDGSLSFDAEGMPLAYYWNMGDGTWLEGVKPSHLYSNLGQYNVMLVVSDGYKKSESSYATVTINNVAPVANAGADQSVPRRALKATLNGSASYDKDGKISSYSWRQISGATVNLLAPNSSTTSFALPKLTKLPHTLVFELAVTDNDGTSSTDQVLVTITN